MDQLNNPTNYTPIEVEYPKKRNIMQLLVELDLATHAFIMILIASLFFGYFLNEKNKEDKIVAQKLSNQNSTQAIIASSNDKNSLYIGQQIVVVNKKYFNISDDFHLTMNGPIKKDVFGYLPYWMVDNLDGIDTRTLTSLSFFGLEVNKNGKIINEMQSDLNKPYYIWQNNPKLKTFLEKAKKNKVKIFVTFKSFNNDTIEKLVSSSVASQDFIDTILYQVNSHNLDGVNIDFEYSGIPSEKTRDQFSILMSSLNDALKSQGSNIKLNISVYATAATINQLWDIPYLGLHSDNIVIMGYDFFTPNSSSAGPVAPLSGYENSLNGIVHNFGEQMPAEKIILAVPYYGYDWTTENQMKNAVVKKDGEVKVLSYAEANDFVKNKKIIFDEKSQTPWYGYVDDKGSSHVFHFENIRSIGAKYDLVNKEKLGGVGIWALGFEGTNAELGQLIIDKFAH